MARRTTAPGSGRSSRPEAPRIDTALKGADYFAALGAEYLARQATLFAVFVAAMFIENRRFHAVIVVLAIASEVAWVLWRYTSLL